RAGRGVGAGGGGCPSGRALACVRPQDFDIRRARGGLGVPAVIRHLFAAGTILRIELQLVATDEIVEVEVDRTHPNPDLLPGRPVMLSPRTVKVFPSPRLITAQSGPPPEL